MRAALARLLRLAADRLDPRPAVIVRVAAPESFGRAAAAVRADLDRALRRAARRIV